MKEWHRFSHPGRSRVKQRRQFSHPGASRGEICALRPNPRRLRRLPEQLRRRLQNITPLGRTPSAPRLQQRPVARPSHRPPTMPSPESAWAMRRRNRRGSGRRRPPRCCTGAKFYGSVPSRPGVGNLVMLTFFPPKDYQTYRFSMLFLSSLTNFL